MRVCKDVVSVIVSLGLMLAVTVILWQINLTAAGSLSLIYLYLFPVVLIAAVYNGHLAVLCAAVAIVCADLFLQRPLYSFVNDNPREYGDLIYFALLALTAIKFIRVLARPAARRVDTRSRYGWG